MAGLKQFLWMLISIEFLSAQSYISFPDFGFEVKIPKEASTYNQNGIFTIPLEKGFKYVKSSGNSAVEVFVEIYKVSCLDANVFYQEMETLLKRMDGKESFTNIKTEKYQEPFGWLVFKGEATKSSTFTFKKFVNAFLSNEYLVLMVVGLRENEYLNFALDLVADNRNGKVFRTLERKINLKDLGLQLNFNGYLNMQKKDNLQGYEFLRCGNNITEFPNFQIIELDLMVMRQYNKRILQFSDEIQRGGKMIDEAIQWSDKGNSKLSNSEKKIFIYKTRFSDNTLYDIYEVYYKFDFKGKSYLAILFLPINYDFHKSTHGLILGNNPSVESIFRLYDKEMIKILESVENM